MLNKPTKTLFEELLELTASGLDDENDKAAQRDRYLREIFEIGGKGFVERIRKYGYTDKGDRAHVEPWFAEYAELIGDFRIPYTLTTGAAQCGKSFCHNLLLSDIIVHGKLNIGFFYATRDSRDINFHEQIKPVLEKYADEYEKDRSITVRERSDKKIASRYQVGGTTGIFAYLSTSTGSPSQNKTGLASAGAGGVSFTANVCFVEEASQSTQEAKAIVPPRLLASKVPTKPRRDLGTPGNSGGVEADMVDCTQEFYPHAQCPHCRKIFPLHPIGCLLKKVKRKNFAGKVVETPFSDSGKPIDWFRHDDSSPTRSAYIGCPHCDKELPNGVRYAARYKCLKTGVWLRDFLDNLPVNDVDACAIANYKVGIHISPLVRKIKYNLATDLVEKGLSSPKPADWQQQQLGIPSSSEINSITLEMLKKALIAPNKPDGSPSFILCGMDMGRANDFLTIAQFYLPDNYLYLDQTEISRQTIRRIIFSKEVEREKAKEIIRAHKVDYGICDNEPGRDGVMVFCNDVGRLEMADQKDTLKDAVKKDKVLDGGAEYPCWFVRNQKFQDIILENFIEMAEDGYPLYRLPEAWNKFLGSKSDLSPFKHLTSPTRDPETEKWVRASDGNDDLFYSFLFLEVAFYIKCLQLGTYPGWINQV